MKHISWQKPTAAQKKYGVDLVGYDGAGNRYEVESESVRGAGYHEVYLVPAAGSFGGGVREKVCSRGTLGLAKACAEESAARMVRQNPSQKRWFVGVMPANGGAVHVEAFESDRSFAGGQPWGGYLEVWGPYADKARAKSTAKAETEYRNQHGRLNPAFSDYVAAGRRAVASGAASASRAAQATVTRARQAAEREAAAVRTREVSVEDAVRVLARAHGVKTNPLRGFKLGDRVRVPQQHNYVGEVIEAGPVYSGGPHGFRVRFGSGRTLWLTADEMVYDKRDNPARQVSLFGRGVRGNPAAKYAVGQTVYVRDGDWDKSWSTAQKAHIVLGPHISPRTGRNLWSVQTADDIEDGTSETNMRRAAPGSKKANPSRAPAWFTAGKKAGALPHAEGEHGMWSLISRDGTRVVTDADSGRGKLCIVLGYTDDGEFVEAGGSREVSTVKALEWLKGAAKVNSRRAKVNPYGPDAAERAGRPTYVIVFYRGPNATGGVVSEELWMRPKVEARKHAQHVIYELGKAASYRIKKPNQIGGLR